MMDYEIFKDVVSVRIRDFLPPLFKFFRVEISEVPKNNGAREAMVLSLEGYEHKIASPTIYLDDLYERFSELEDLDSVLEEASVIILNFTGALPSEMVQMDMSEMTGSIAATLISTEKNGELLENVPHRNWHDLSVVYRFIIDKNDGSGYAAALVTNEILEDIEMTEDELFSVAMENGKTMFKTEVLHLAPDFHVVTTEMKLFGASVMLRTEDLHELAETVGSDLYLIPSSIHEVMAVPEKDTKLSELYVLLEEGNRNYVAEDEFLSDSIYCYRKDSGKVEIIRKNS